jgi:hypothetical protein
MGLDKKLFLVTRTVGTTGACGSTAIRGGGYQPILEFPEYHSEQSLGTNHYRDYVGDYCD